MVVRLISPYWSGTRIRQSMCVYCIMMSNFHRIFLRGNALKKLWAGTHWLERSIKSSPTPSHAQAVDLPSSSQGCKLSVIQWLRTRGNVRTNTLSPFVSFRRDHPIKCCRQNRGFLNNPLHPISIVLRVQRIQRFTYRLEDSPLFLTGRTGDPRSR
jgi:hypothetical protein